MINRVVLVGRTTKDPELRYTNSNIAVTTFTVACNRSFKNDAGGYDADFINCLIWRKQAENVAKYVSKGALIGVEGRIQTRTYEDNGVRKYITEIVCDSVQFLESRNSNNSNKNSSYTNKKETNDFKSTQSNDKIEIEDDDDLPF